MSKLNKKSMVLDTRVSTDVRLAGGSGMKAANQEAEQLLRRAVMASLLWEDLAYESGKDNANNIAKLIPQVDPKVVADIAVETRLKQKLRHISLFIACEMAKHPEHKKHVEYVLNAVITRADQITDFMAIYWKNKKVPIANSIRKALAKCFNKFNEYSFSKYNRATPIKFRDVMFMVHPTPENNEKEVLFKKIAENTLAIADTWETELSAGKDKKETFTRLINENKLGGLAFLRNLRNMKEAGVSYDVLKKGFERLSGNVLLPLNFYGAQKHNPEYTKEIENAMIQAYSTVSKLPGHTVFVMDLSGSMQAGLASKSTFSRLDAGYAMAVLANEISERSTIYATAGSDSAGKHKTVRVGNHRGFGLVTELENQKHRLGGGGIFTRQCLEFIKSDLKEIPDRIIVFSDSADCDFNEKRLPQPFGTHNYIVDVSAHARGINYKGVWTAEISGFSENFLTFIRAYEGLDNNFEEKEVDAN